MNQRTSIFRAKSRESVESSNSFESVRTLVVLQFVEGVAKVGHLTKGQRSDLITRDAFTCSRARYVFIGI